MIDNEITKVELLWTRNCPLRCSYCAMATGGNNTLSIDFWKKAIDQWKKLNCGFVAIYGAEPLTEDVDKLGQAIQYMESLKIRTTVITSGCVPNFREKIQKLYDYGLRSLSMSYDILPLDKSSKAKTEKALDNLLWFREKEGVRDAAAIATLSRVNYKELPESIKKLSAMNIWTFFDMIHTDRGQPGCKVKDTPLTRELLFKEEDYPELERVLKEIMDLKDQGYLCHTSKLFVEEMSKDNYQHLRNYDWHCAKEACFPSWISVDYNGHCYPCDDFHVVDNPKIFMADKIAEEFNDFRDYYKEMSLKLCSGCCWNTHIDSNRIKEGKLAFSNYVHADVKKGE